MGKTLALSLHQSSYPVVRSAVPGGCAGGLGLGSLLYSSFTERCSEPYMQNNLHQDLKANALIL